MGSRLEVLTGEYGDTVTNMPKQKAEKAAQHRAIIHYKEQNGNTQYRLQQMATNILKYGTRVAECHHVSQEFHPNGEKRIIMTGSYCIEVLNELTGSRYWVHFDGCRVTEIIEEYLKD